MHPPLPPEIRVENGRQGVRYLLPPRETGPLKFVAVFFIGFGCLFGGFALFWILGVLGLVFEGSRPAGSPLFALFGVPFLLVGLGIIGLGVFAWGGRSEVEIQGGELLARERGGPFRWTRRVPVKSIRQFTVSTDAVGMRANGQPVASSPNTGAAALTADVGDGRPRLVVLGYPTAWVQALAARLNADIGAQTGTAPQPVSVTQVDSETDRNVIRGDRFDPPAKTSISISQMAGGLVVVIPPQGARASRGLLFFAMAWLAFVAVVGCMFIVIPDTPRKRTKDRAISSLVLGGFALVGGGLLAISLHQMRRKASLRASRDELIILEQSLFGTKTFKRPAGVLAAIRIGNSGIAVNDVPVQELQVHTADGRRHGFFTNLTNDELHWLATHLRQATGTPEQPGGPLNQSPSSS